MASSAPYSSVAGSSSASAADHVTTLQSVLNHQAELEAEAREIMPYAFDECTYDKGALKQSVWACLDCEGKGVCYSCSLSCHAECRLVELFQRRKFTCDCPTASAPCPESEPKVHKRCTLYRGHAPPPLPANEGNNYGPNFQGVFCRCLRPYNPQTENELMIACLACEDWFHESCLNLQEPSAPVGPTASAVQSATVLPDPAGNAPAPPYTNGNDDDAEDVADADESPILPSDAYEHLICAACVQKYPILQRYAGTEGWMMVVPAVAPSAIEGKAVDIKDRLRVVGAKGAPQTGVPPEQSPASGDKEGDRDSLISPTSMAGMKRKAEEDACIASSKRAKAETTANGTKKCTLPPADEAAWEIFAGSDIKSSATGVTAKGDVFLGEDALFNVCRCSTCAPLLASLPFPLEEEEIYEPPLDLELEPDLDAQTAKALDALPRSQALESIMKYNEMKNKLKAFLEPFSADGRIVSTDDINDFWVSMRSE